MARRVYKWNTKNHVFPSSLLVEKRAPGRIRTIIRRRYREFGASEHVGHKNLRAVLAAGIAKEHQIKAVRGPSRPLVVVAFGQDPLARPIRTHYTDRERTALLLGKGDIVAFRRPDWRRIASFAKRNAFRAASGC